MLSRIARLWWGLALLAAGALFILGAAACSDSDDEPSPEEIQAVEDIIRQLFAATSADADFVFAHVTDNLLETAFFSTREDCMANPEECIGDPSTVESVSDIAIDGDDATATVVLDFGTFTVGLKREDDVWKGDSLLAMSDVIPEGAAVVDLGLSEFTFALDATAIPADGNFGFHVSNVGEQAHEVVVFNVPADADLQEFLESEEGPPPLGFKIFILPDQEVDMAFEAPLEPGRYALVCFFPDTDDPEMTPHFAKGMLTEFTIE
jgi:hypothetical protein